MIHAKSATNADMYKASLDVGRTKPDYEGPNVLIDALVGQNGRVCAEASPTPDRYRS